MVIVAAASPARADVTVGGAIGAGGQGAATYSALELSLDAAWGQRRIGLAARGVWLDGEFRSDDWSGWRALRTIRLVEVDGTLGDVRLALAGGGLAPARLAHVADDYRATLDDRPRTGVRTAAAFDGEQVSLAIDLELDDVVEPSFTGGVVSVRRGDWIGRAASAVDVSRTIDGTPAAIELSGGRRWDGDGWRFDTGAGAVGEPGASGIAALGFAETALDRTWWGHAVRWVARGEVRVGTGTLGGAFGPLHQIERGELYGRTHRGFGAALDLGAASDRGWITAGVRARPDLGPLATLSFGAPADRRIQLAAWIAASSHVALGAGALRIAWARHLASALEVGRIAVGEPAMDPAMADSATAAWSATAWFAVTSP